MSKQGFTPFPKVPRWSRDIVITEKLDGTNAAVRIIDCADPSPDAAVNVPNEEPIANVGDLYFFAQSRTRLIEPGDDNFGFAAWVVANASDLAGLGPGVHFGEYWGRGIQRNYGLDERRFSLFNTARWADAHVAGEFPVLPDGQSMAPLCCHVVPTLYAGPCSELSILLAVKELEDHGSVAAPGFATPEGIMVWHEAARQLFKKTIVDDEKPKGAA